MDITSIIVSLISAICTAVCAYIAIVHQVQKTQIKTEDIENAIDNCKSLQDIKAGLKSEMRKSLIADYWRFADKGFDLSKTEEENWKDDVKYYQALGGNGLIVELDNTLQLSLLERERSKDSDRVIKL